jgi:hypothetical protein
MRGLGAGMYSSEAATVRATPADIAATGESDDAPVYEGKRETTLWSFCMQQLSLKDHDIDAIVAAAIARNSTFVPPLPHDRVLAAATSAWERTAKGLNWFGQHGSFLPKKAVNDMVRDPYMLALISWLQSENGPDSTFWVADGLADKLGWPRRQLASARRKAVEAGWIVPLNAPARGQPITYRWGQAGRAQRSVL